MQLKRVAFLASTIIAHDIFQTLQQKLNPYASSPGKALSAAVLDQHPSKVS